MGLSASQLSRFMAAADQTLSDLFPASIKISGTTYTGTGVGGNALNTYLDGGKVQQGDRYFRIPKSQLTAAPAAGTLVEWLEAPTGTARFLKIMDCPIRPQETSWMIHCEPRDR